MDEQDFKINVFDHASAESRQAMIDEVARKFVVECVKENGSPMVLHATLTNLYYPGLKMVPRNGAMHASSEPVVANGVQSTKKSKDQPKAKSQSEKGGRRSPKQIAASVDKVLSFIASNPGLRTEQIVEGIGHKKATIDALHRLRNDGKIKAKGIKRAMTYTAK